jgi:hypothetical protein
MTTLKKITNSNFFIKLKNWEYWPFGIIQFPVIIYFLFLSLRARSLFFFSASNPGIPMGGMFGESKYDVLKKIPSQYIPKTIKVPISATAADVIKTIRQEGFSLPVIFKPDLGERGFMVKRINSDNDIQPYLEKLKIDFLIQDLVDLPMEFGVFYMRIPGEESGKVISVVIKEMLSVEGDGRSTLKDLIMHKDRARLQWDKLKETYKARLYEIVPAGERIELVSIGNHALGTKFLNGNRLITEKLSYTFHQISSKIPDFYFGRFDVRCARLEDLYEGKIKIMEVNGCGAEPAHIYDPAFTLPKAVAVLLQHWRNIFVIAMSNHRRGVKFTSLKEGIRYYKTFRAATK